MTPRQPTAAHPERIAPLANLPVFHKLAGRRVIMAGRGDGAIWKAELLAAAGAQIQFFTDWHDDRLDDLAADLKLRAGEGTGRIDLIGRVPVAADFTGAALAVGSFSTAAEARNFAALARAAGLPLNVIDKPEFCDFSFGSIVNRSPLVVAISTDGAAPVFGQAIRARIEAMLPRTLQNWVAAAQSWRPQVQTRIATMALRRQFWRRFADLAFANAERLPTPQDQTELFDASTSEAATGQTGEVLLVGAGPGDPDLLTIKAIRALQSADVILFDDLVSPEVLDLGRREAERMRVGKAGHGPSCHQSDINALMVSLALAGQRVVRLKSGDPLIFGRASEEIEACRAAGIKVSIVPGISAAQAGAATLQVSLTERELARRLQFVTGHGSDGQLPGDIDWQAISDPVATTVIYMPRRTLAAFCSRAINMGLSPSTPAIAMLSITRADQDFVATTIGTLPDAVTRLADGPVIVMIGRAFQKILPNESSALDRTDFAIPSIFSVG